MAETLIALIKNIIKENRNFNLEEIHKYKKLKLINNQLNNEFKLGLKKELFLPLFKFYVKDKVLFDSDEYDYIIINISIKFLNSILSKLLYLNLDKSTVIEGKYIDTSIELFFQNLYLDYDVVTFFEISDKKARIAIMRKGADNIVRKTCKEYNDFHFYNINII